MVTIEIPNGTYYYNDQLSADINLITVLNDAITNSDLKENLVFNIGEVIILPLKIIRQNQ